MSASYTFGMLLATIGNYLRERGREIRIDGSTWTARFHAGSWVIDLEAIDEQRVQLTFLEHGLYRRSSEVPLSAEGARAAAEHIDALIDVTALGSPDDDEDLQYICAACVADRALGATIDAEGVLSECHYCHRRARVFSMEDFATRVHRVFELYAQEADQNAAFDPDSDDVYYYPGGRTPMEILRDQLGIENEAVATDLLAQLQSDYVRRRPEDPDYYDSDSETYDLRLPYSGAHNVAWDKFTRSVKHQKRFFNQHHESYLKKIFDPLLAGDLTSGVPPIISFGPSATLSHIYRGRKADTTAALNQLYANPAKEFAPPPPALRRQGRMNAAGIAAFYGSTDVKTCVAELRPDVGGGVVVAKFELLRSVKLLDLRQLAVSSTPFSWYDEHMADKVAFTEFMRRLHREIRKPVLPGSETLDYLPTQIISEYLAHLEDVGLDGVLFTSSLTSRLREDDYENEDDYEGQDIDDADGPRKPDIGLPATRSDEAGLNVVLFAHAAVVYGQTGSPTHKIGDITVDRGKTQTVDAMPLDPKPVLESVPLAHRSDDEREYDPTLRLADKGPFTYLRVRAISYDLDALEVDLRPPFAGPEF